MLCHQTRDILLVKKLLGHKRLENTMIYTHLIQTGEDTFISRVALTTKEICELVDKGFEYVCEHNGVKTFRKRK